MAFFIHFCTLVPGVMSQINTESNGENSIFANKGNWGEILGQLFITSSSSHFLNKTDFEQDLLKDQSNLNIEY